MHKRRRRKGGWVQSKVIVRFLFGNEAKITQSGIYDPLYFEDDKGNLGVILPKRIAR